MTEKGWQSYPQCLQEIWWSVFGRDENRKLLELDTSPCYSDEENERHIQGILAERAEKIAGLERLIHERLPFLGQVNVLYGQEFYDPKNWPDYLRWHQEGMRKRAEKSEEPFDWTRYYIRFLDEHRSCKPGQECEHRESKVGVAVSYLLQSFWQIESDILKAMIEDKKPPRVRKKYRKIRAALIRQFGSPPDSHVILTSDGQWESPPDNIQ